MVKVKFPKAVRDAFFDADIGLNESAIVELDKDLLKSPHVSLEAKGFYAWSRSKDPYLEYDVDSDLSEAMEPEFFEEVMQQLIDEGVALRYLYAIDEPCRYEIFECKMSCFWSYLSAVAQDEDVEASQPYGDYLDSLMPKEREKLLSKVLP